MEHDEKNRDLSSEVEESAKSIKCKGKKRRQGSNRVAAYRPGIKLAKIKDKTKCNNGVQQTRNNESQYNKKEKGKENKKTLPEEFPKAGCSWMDPYQDQNINEDQSTSSSDEDQSTSSLDEDLKRAIAESLKDMEDRVTQRSI